jgi:hypothetical protein
LVFKVRTATGTTNLPVVLGRTHAGIKVNVPQYLLNVRSNQMRYAQYDPYAAYVDIDDVGLQDDLHLDSLGAMSLGMRMGTAQLGLTEPNPCINLEQAADQPDPTALRTVCFRVRASKPLNSISIADFALSGTAGPTTAAVWRASAYDGTSEVYTVAVSGMTNGGNVSISMPRNKVASGVVSNFPSVSEDNRIAFGLPATTTNLLVHDDGNGPVGRLDKSTPGFGWRNVGWVVNSNPTQGYELTTSAPMTYSNLLVNAPYAKGGTGYLTSGRAFDILNALRPYHTDGDLTNIGRSNDEYWVSFLARRDQDRPWTLALCRYNSATWWDTARVIAVDQAGGYWLLQLMGDGGNQVTTTVAATVGQTYLMVLRIRFAGVLASNTVDLFINPWPLGGDAPSVPTASLSTNAANFKFSRIMWYPGYGVNQGSLDEFRLGTTYAAVTPVLPSNSVPQIQTTNLPLAVLGQPYGTALRAINGAGRVRWILDHGTLPAGVALDALGVISGVPAAAGSNYFRVLVRDDAAQAATQSLALAVLPEPAVTLGVGVLAWVCRWTHPCKTCNVAMPLGMDFCIPSTAGAVATCGHATWHGLLHTVHGKCGHATWHGLLHTVHGKCGHATWHGLLHTVHGRCRGHMWPCHLAWTSINRPRQAPRLQGRRQRGRDGARPSICGHAAELSAFTSDNNDTDRRHTRSRCGSPDNKTMPRPGCVVHTHAVPAHH